MVGHGDEATIRSSVATVGSVSGTTDVGGLVGDGSDRSANFFGYFSVRIISSVANVGEISGYNEVGGLVGDGGDHSADYFGFSIIIRASVANVGEISGNDEVGGLVGDGRAAFIRSSVANVGEISGNDEVGGLVGWGSGATITSSVANVGEISSVNFRVGGLIGQGYGGGGTTVTSAYYDNKVIFTYSNAGFNSFGEGHSTADLRGPTMFANSIYSTWVNHYCNPNTGGVMTIVPPAAAPGGDYIQTWDLGTTTEYPALNCLLQFSPAEQRQAAARAVAGQSPLPN